MNQLLSAYNIARAEIGVMEVSGSEANPTIVKYHRSTPLASSSDEVSWCSAFVNWCMSMAFIAGTASPAARSWLKWGMETIEPVEGDIVVLKRGEGWQGHVGFFVKRDAKYVTVLGGNQKDSVCESVYLRSRVLGYRTLA